MGETELIGGTKTEILKEKFKEFHNEKDGEVEKS
jgi:hypothetical protein